LTNEEVHELHEHDSVQIGHEVYVPHRIDKDNELWLIRVGCTWHEPANTYERTLAGQTPVMRGVPQDFTPPPPPKRKGEKLMLRVGFYGKPQSEAARLAARQRTREALTKRAEAELPVEAAKRSLADIAAEKKALQDRAEDLAAGHVAHAQPIAARLKTLTASAVAAVTNREPLAADAESERLQLATELAEMNRELQRQLRDLEERERDLTLELLHATQHANTLGSVDSLRNALANDLASPELRKEMFIADRDAESALARQRAAESQIANLRAASRPADPPPTYGQFQNVIGADVDARAQLEIELWEAERDHAGTLLADARQHKDALREQAFAE